MVRIAGRNSDHWWYQAGTLILTIVSAVGLFTAAGMPNLASASVAQWVVFAVCVYGLGRIFEIIFDVVVAIVDAKRRLASPFGPPSPGERRSANSPAQKSRIPSG